MNKISRSVGNRPVAISRPVVINRPVDFNRPVVSGSVGKQMAEIHSYKDLIVWQRGVQLSVLVYRVTKSFPKAELYGIVSQMRRCSVSIPSNIAEGYSRHKRGEYVQFLYFAFASGAELETQLTISLELNYLSAEDFQRVNDLLQEVQRMLNSLISKLKVR